MTRTTLDSGAALQRSPARRPRLPALVMGALGLMLVLPPLLHGLSLSGQRALLVTLITIVLSTTRWLDSGASALLGVTLLALTGASRSFREALQGFASPVPYFLVGVLALGVAVAKSGLAECVARHILDRARGRPLAMYVQLVLAMPVLLHLSVRHHAVGHPRAHLRGSL